MSDALRETSPPDPADDVNRWSDASLTVIRCRKVEPISERAFLTYQLMIIGFFFG